jgi:hypothetical protein
MIVFELMAIRLMMIALTIARQQEILPVELTETT